MGLLPPELVGTYVLRRWSERAYRVRVIYFLGDPFGSRGEELRVDERE